MKHIPELAPVNLNINANDASIAKKRKVNASSRVENCELKKSAEKELRGGGVPRLTIQLICNPS